MAISPPARAVIEREAERCYPAEACGFLVGREVAGRATATSARPAANRAKRHDRFLIDPEEVLAAIIAARANGEQILGAYHSHPDIAPRPSATDRDEAWGEWLTLIVSCDDGVAGARACWRMGPEGVVEIPIVLRASGQPDTEPALSLEGGAP